MDLQWDQNTIAIKYKIMNLAQEHIILINSLSVLVQKLELQREMN
jgi:hypothetical protein